MPVFIHLSLIRQRIWFLFWKPPLKSPFSLDSSRIKERSDSCNFYEVYMRLPHNPGTPSGVVSASADVKFSCRNWLRFFIAKKTKNTYAFPITSSWIRSEGISSLCFLVYVFFFFFKKWVVRLGHGHQWRTQYLVMAYTYRFTNMGDICEIRCFSKPLLPWVSLPLTLCSH